MEQQQKVIGKAVQYHEVEYAACACLVEIDSGVEVECTYNKYEEGQVDYDEVTSCQLSVVPESECYHLP